MIQKYLEHHCCFRREVVDTVLTLLSWLRSHLAPDLVVLTGSGPGVTVHSSRVTGGAVIFGSPCLCYSDYIAFDINVIYTVRTPLVYIFLHHYTDKQNANPLIITFQPLFVEMQPEITRYRYLTSVSI